MIWAVWIILIGVAGLAVWGIAELLGSVGWYWFFFILAVALGAVAGLVQAIDGTPVKAPRGGRRGFPVRGLARQLGRLAPSRSNKFGKW